jgi:ribosome-binding factor A
MEITFVSRDADALQVLQNELSDGKYSFRYVVKDIRKKADLDGYDVYISPANSFGELRGGD